MGSRRTMSECSGRHRMIGCDDLAHRSLVRNRIARTFVYQGKTGSQFATCHSSQLVTYIMSQPVVEESEAQAPDGSVKMADEEAKLRAGSLLRTLETRHWLPPVYDFDSRALTSKQAQTPSGADALGVSNADSPLSSAQHLGCCIRGCPNPLGSSYYRKYKICEEHAKSPAVTMGGIPVRFCQKCGRFQDLNMFDGSRRSCRFSLEAHNKRRRAKLSTKDATWRATKKEEKPSPKPLRVASTRNKRTVNGTRKLADDGSSSDIDILETGSLANRSNPDAPSDVCQSLEELEREFGPPDTEPLLAGFEIADAHPYRSEYIEQTLSLKFHGATPDELCPSLLSDIQHQLPSVNPETSWYEGAIRPGCTHVSVRMRFEKGEEDEVARMKSVLTERLAAGLSASWRGRPFLSKGMEVQMGNSVTHVASGGSSFTMHALPHMSVHPHVVRSGDKVEFDIVIDGIDLEDKMVAVLCRQNGRYLTTSIVFEDGNNGEDVEKSGENLGENVEAFAAGGSDESGFGAADHDEEGVPEDDTASFCSTESSRSVSGRNSIGSEGTMERNGSGFFGTSRRLVSVLGLAPGSCEIEVMVDNALTAPASVLVLPTDECVHDARRILEGMGSRHSKAFINDAGLVVRSVYSPNSLNPSDMPLIQRLAIRTCDWTMERRSSHLVRILQEALPPENECCGYPGRLDDEIESYEDGMPHFESKKGASYRLDELDMGHPTRSPMTPMMPSKLYQSYETYEMETEGSIVQSLCDGVFRLTIEEKQSLREGDGWRNVAWQLAVGFGLILLASNT